MLVIALTMTAMLATGALAGDHPSTSAAKKTLDKAACSADKAACSADKATCSVAKAPGKCCVESASNGKACCGKDAETVAAKVASFNASQAALGDMHKCCAEAVVAGKGCCGKDAKELHATHAKNAAVCKTVLTSMGKCCAKAYVKGEGCCGKDAADLKASTNKACDAVKHAAGDAKKSTES